MRKEVENRNKTAADLGVWLGFEDEAGQGLGPSRAARWARRGHSRPCG